MKVPRALKICSIVTTILIIAVLITLVTLYFTILKPKQPKVTTQQVTVDHWNFIPPFNFNVTLGIVLNIYNPNYASFKYDQTTANVTYHDTLAAEAPIEADTIPERDNHDIKTEVLVIVNDLVTNPFFWIDFASGSVNFTSLAIIHGKAKVLGLFKIKATTYSTCTITLHVLAENVSSVCESKVEY